MADNEAFKVGSGWGDENLALAQRSIPPALKASIACEGPPTLILGW
jgi:hypothetical protein